MLIDTHCHLHDLEWFTPEQQTEFLESAHQLGVEQLICIGTNPEDSQHARAFASEHAGVYWTYGIHPEFASRQDVIRALSSDNALSKSNSEAEPVQNHGPKRLILTETANFFERIKRAKAERAEGDTRKDGLSTGSREKDSSLNQIDLVAIGEIGLDYHYEPYDREAQIRLFESTLQLARDLHLPVSLHIREAFADAFPVLDNFPELTGVLHSFTGSKRELRQALDRGFYIGMNGLSTYSTLPLPPLDRIVLETDAPFLTPVPFRGTINQPGYVRYVAKYLMDQFGTTEKEIEEQTTKNARQVFGI